MRFYVFLLFVDLLIFCGHITKKILLVLLPSPALLWQALYAGSKTRMRLGTRASLARLRSLHATYYIPAVFFCI